ncbi:SNF2-related protein [Aerococcus urinae]|uniref:DEAD/DEAH box helicase n=1 Tax=Aerococcus urinae TaxID=1376 RepID=UPI00254C80F3|nr:SNF2-related protein [Aerococcus urinae]MDK6689710.1 SNF2-related protein [Aerococcus urinae]
MKNKIKINKATAKELLKDIDKLTLNDHNIMNNSELESLLKECSKEYNHLMQSKLSDISFSELKQVDSLNKQGNIFLFPPLMLPGISLAYETNRRKIAHLLFNFQTRLKVEKEHSDFIESLRKNLEFVINNDRNSFALFFMNKKNRSQLKENKEWILENYEHIELLKSKLKEAIDKSSDNKDYLIIIQDNKAEIDKVIVNKTTYLENRKDNLLLEIEEYLGQVQAAINLIDVQSLEGEIKSQINQIKEKKGLTQALNQPLRVLNIFSDEKLHLNRLKDRGITNLADLQTKLWDVRPRSGLTTAACWKIETELNKYLEYAKKDYYPRMDLQKLDLDEITLLKLIYRYIHLAENEEKNLDLLKVTLKRAQNNLDIIWDRQLNSYQMTQLEVTKQEETVKLYYLLFDCFNQLTAIPKKLWQVPKLSNSEAINDFESNIAKYYAVIDKVNGGGRKDTNDLPSLVVDKVNKFQLDNRSFKGILRPYQEFGVKYALTFKKVLLGDEMGLGKTIQALAIANHLSQKGYKHHVVLGPLSILMNWQREIKKWTTMESFVYRNANREEAFENWQDQGGVLLLNYEQATHLVENQFSMLPSLVIVDEAHYIKNPWTKRSKNAYRLAQLADYNLFMTGTPLENRLKEMKQLLSVLQPDLDYFKDNDQGFFNDYNDNPQAFRDGIATVYLRRKREDVLRDLPEIEMVEMWSSFSEEEQDYYNEAVMRGISGLQMMRRAAFSGRDRKHSEKIANACDICQEAMENGDKIIIFSFFKLVLNKLKDFLGDNVIGMISGDVSTAERQELIDQLENSGKGSILLAQIDAGGVGLNIQAANIVILCEPQWKPSTEQQAIGRVYRMGQAKNVIVYRLLTEDSIDESMLELLGEKTDLFNDYANDSVVSDAYDRTEADPINEKELQTKVLEIERERLKASV